MHPNISLLARLGVLGCQDGAHLEVKDTGLPGLSPLLVPGESAASKNAPGGCGWSVSASIIPPWTPEL